jgi:hypothetical protein
MAKYTYKETNEWSNYLTWSAKLQRINPVSLASPHHTEIYFTQPMELEFGPVLRPHVTFVSSSGTTHWYVKNSGGKYGVERDDTRVAAHPNEATIAQNVIDDAVALTWIKPAPPPTLKDGEGFITKFSVNYVNQPMDHFSESRIGQRGRMQTGWR